MFIVFNEFQAAIWGFTKEEIQAAKKHPTGNLRGDYYLSRPIPTEWELHGNKTFNGPGWPPIVPKEK